MKKLIMYLFLLFSATTLFVACEEKSDDTTEDGKKPTTEFDSSVQQQARTEAVSMDFDNTLNLIISQVPFRAAETNSFQVTPDWDNKTLTVTFPDGYKGQDGLTRTGSILIRYTSTIPAPGTIYTITSSDYTIDGYKITGTITKTVTEYTSYITSATIGEDITITYPAGGTITRKGIITRGYIYDPNGNHTISSSGQVTITELSGRKVNYSANSNTPLIYRTLWAETIKGILTAQVQGAATIWTIDFGNGTPDGGKVTVYRD